MNKPSPYHFDSFASLLAAWIEWLKTTDNKFSLRWLAKRLNLKSHTHLLRLAHGEKSPTDPLLAHISTLMGLTVDEFAFVRLLAALSRSKRPEERSILLERIASMRSQFPDLLLELDSFELISHWHHLAILEMTVLPQFQSSPDWIASQLDYSISTEMVTESLARLKRLGLIKEEADGKITRVVDQINTTHNIPSIAIRNYHREMLERTREAIDRVPLKYRYFFSRTMPIDTSKLDQAADLLIEFRGRFQKLLEGGTPDSVYHLGLQLIPLTKIEDERLETAQNEPT